MTQSILNVKGVGKATVIILAKGGFKTVNDLANASVNKLALLPSFSDVRALQVIKNANNLLEQVSIEKTLSSVSIIKEKAIPLLIMKEEKPAKDKKKSEKSKSKDKDMKKGSSKKKVKKLK